VSVLRARALVSALELPGVESVLELGSQLVVSALESPDAGLVLVLELRLAPVLASA
jgi:hypothetical protein